jgi:hypothetical protein
MLMLATAAVLAFERWVTEDSPHLASHRMSACAAIDRSGVVVCGGQMVSHGRGKLAQVDAQEDGAILVLACGEESQHLIHEVGRPPVAERWHVEQRVHLLPFSLFVGLGQPSL